MKLRPFIFIYSATLLAWLGVTYVTPQPTQRYRPSAPATAKNTPTIPAPTEQPKAKNLESEPERSVSASR